MIKIALLGAGSSVARYILSRSGEEVIGIYRSHRALSQLCDLNLGSRLKKASTQGELIAALRGCQTAVNMVNDENPLRARQSLANLIDASASAGVKQIIHMSSSAVYGCRAAEVTLLDEAHNGPTWSSYAAGKRWQEALLKRKVGRLPSLVVLRPGLIWGPGMAWLHRPASELVRGDAWIVEGDAVCNLVHVSLVYRAINYFAQETPSGLHFCNIADRQRIRWQDYYRRIAVALKLSDDILIKTVPRKSLIWWQGVKSLRYVFPFGVCWSVLPPGPKGFVKLSLLPLTMGAKVATPLYWGPSPVAVDRESWELKAFDGSLPGNRHLEKLHEAHSANESGLDALLKAALVDFPTGISHMGYGQASP
jgi:nucleoside-diphosphate-sugar epimerase